MKMSVPAVSMDQCVAPNIRRVLVYRLGSLGDMLVSLPAMHLVDRRFPRAERRLLTNFPVISKAPAAASVFGDSGLIHGYERYEVGVRTPLKLLALAWRIRRFRPEVLVYLTSARGVAVAERDARFFGTVCGVRRLIGVPVTEDMQHSREEAGVFETEASRLARNLAVLGNVDLEDPANWNLHLNAAEIAAAERALQLLGGRPFLAVSIGTKVQAKDWGVDNWRAFLARLAQIDCRYALVLVGAAEESAASEFSAEGWRSVEGAGPVVNLCGRLTPRESAAALARAAVFIGHDSGPMHLAAAVQTPCVAIFAARNKPRVWFPFGRHHRVLYHRVDCWGCGLEMCLEQRRKCLLSITVDEVLNAVREVLLGRPVLPITIA